jgi:hypothetical protein
MQSISCTRLHCGELPFKTFLRPHSTVARCKLGRTPNNSQRSANRIWETGNTQCFAVVLPFDLSGLQVFFDWFEVLLRRLLVNQDLNALI